MASLGIRQILSFRHRGDDVYPSCDVQVKVWGDYACFTRPEFKVERVSYPVMTPSAARGILEAIFWKPEFRWEVREIWILKHIQEEVIVRNEIDSRQTPNVDYLIVEERRQQRATLYLKEPSYLIFADIVLKDFVDCSKKKYLEQFKRRLEKGKCFHQPYLGTRECTAYFSPPDGTEKPNPVNISIGQMLFDISFCVDEEKKDIAFVKKANNDVCEEVSGFIRPVVFAAEVKNGVLEIPPEKYDELYRWEGVHVKRAG